MSLKPKTIRFQLPGTLESLIQIEGQVKAVLADLPQTPEIEMMQYNFTLALHELCVNIVEHAYETTQGDIQIELTLQSQPWMIQAVVLDSGDPFDVATTSEPNLDVPQEGGYGLFLMEQLVDEVQYSRLPEGNEWRLRRKLD